MQKIISIEQVREGHLCTGCGVCAALEPDRFEMQDVITEGRRPSVVADAVPTTGEAFSACPGVRLQHEFDHSDPDLAEDMADAWGPVYQVVEGHAQDPQIRYSGSSGGAATALALYCLERQGMRGVLHTAADPEKPYCNRTVMSRSRSDLLAATGSRYSPSSPCADLGRIIEGEGQHVFIGKPCDVAAVRGAEKISAALRENLGLTIAFFCAGVPSTAASLKLAAREGAKTPESIRKLRYRGNGWPGKWSLRYAQDDGREGQASLSYAESWDFLQEHRQWRCYICPDHTGEFADISVGDPWYREIGPQEAGSSLIVARTPRGVRILRQAIAAGYLKICREDLSLLERSQPNLLAARGNLWARLHTLRLFGAAVPSFPGFSFFGCWWKQLNLVSKMRSVVGTVKRIYRKRLREPIQS